MIGNIPQNIVEAYKAALKVSDLNPESKEQVFDEVITFCENDDVCRNDKSVKRKTLLFWAYNKLAILKMEANQYEKALDLWQRAQNLVQSYEGKIKLGGRMLNAIEKSKLSMNEKARRIAKTSAFLRDAYLKIGDEENADRMERLQNVASYLLSSSRSKH